LDQLSKRRGAGRVDRTNLATASPLRSKSSTT